MADNYPFMGSKKYSPAQAAELRKLQGTVTSTEKAIADLYRSIGYEVCHVYDSAQLPAVADMMRKVKNHQAELEACKKRISELADEKKDFVLTCPYCDAKLKMGTKYCTNCGEKLDKDDVPPSPDRVDAKVCKKCQAVIGEMLTFCPYCGTKNK